MGKGSLVSKEEGGVGFGEDKPRSSLQRASRSRKQKQEKKVKVKKRKKLKASSQKKAGQL